MNELVCPQPSDPSDAWLGVAIGVAIVAMVLGCAWITWSRRGVRRWAAAGLLVAIAACVAYVRTLPPGFMPTCVRPVELVGVWSGAGATIDIKPDGTFEIPAERHRGRWRVRRNSYVVSVFLDPEPRWAATLGVGRRGSELRLQPYIDDSVAPDREWGDGLARVVADRAQ